jgi:rubredoxin
MTIDNMEIIDLEDKNLMVARERTEFCQCPECGLIGKVRFEHDEQGAACRDCGKVYRASEHIVSKGN